VNKAATIRAIYVPWKFIEIEDRFVLAGDEKYFLEGVKVGFKFAIRRI